MATYGRIRSTRLLVIGLLLASLVTITVDARGGNQGPLAAAGRLLGGIVGPLQEGVSAVFRPVGSFFGNVFRAGTLADRVEILERENTRLQSQLRDASTFEAERDQLAAILGIAQDEDLDLMGATVIAESPSNFEWTVGINRGAQDGVVEDMPVIADAGLVGHVIQVSETTSTVQLIIDPDSHVSARLSQSRDTGLIEGQSEAPLRFGLIQPETEIVPGEIVETSGYRLDEGFTGIYPPGIPIGAVSSVEESDDRVTVRVLVRPNVDFGRLDKVAVVTGTGSSLVEEVKG